MVNLKIIDRDGNEIRIDELTEAGLQEIQAQTKQLLKEINEAIS